MKYQLTNGNTLEVIQDINPESPRKWDNLGKMICFHGRYTLGDKHDYDNRDYSGWAEQKEAISKNENAAIILPLYLYDHSGLTINTTGFSCRWDSGQIGWIVISKEKIREEYSVKRISKKLLESVEEYLVGEVKVYDQYLSGDVYGFKEFDSEGNEVDSCWGFYGSNIEENGIAEHISCEVVK